MVKCSAILLQIAELGGPPLLGCPSKPNVAEGLALVFDYDGMEVLVIEMLRSRWF